MKSISILGADILHPLNYITKRVSINVKIFLEVLLSLPNVFLLFKYYYFIVDDIPEDNTPT